MEPHGAGVVVMPGCNCVAVGVGKDSAGPSFGADRVDCLDDVDEDGSHHYGWTPQVTSGCDNVIVDCFLLQSVQAVASCSCCTGGAVASGPYLLLGFGFTLESFRSRPGTIIQPASLARGSGDAGALAHLAGVDLQQPCCLDVKALASDYYLLVLFIMGFARLIFIYLDFGELRCFLMKYFPNFDCLLHPVLLCFLDLAEASCTSQLNFVPLFGPLDSSI